MSILRNVIFNVRERITSGDLNQLQAETAVNSQAAARAQSRSGAEQTGLVSFGFRDNRKQVAGLAPSLTGAPNTLELLPGALMTYSPAYPTPIPGEAFTPWRLFNGLDGANTPLAVPIPGVGPTWYLLEARVGQAITSQVRDIRSLFTGLFVPQLVPKELDTTLETQWTAGADGGPFPLPSGGEWVPICYVYRTNLGGIITAADVYDVRPLPSDLNQYASQAAEQRRGEFDWRTTGLNTIELTTVRAARAQGVPLEAGYFVSAAPPSSDLDLSTIHDTGDGPFAAGIVYYLYIAPFRGLAPRRLDQPYTRGRLVLSSTPPSLQPVGFTDAAERVWTNSGNVGDPGPGGNIAPGEGILIGSFTRDAANTGFGKSVQTGRTVQVDGTAAGAPFGSKTFSSVGNTINPFLLPAQVQEIDITATWNATNGAPVTADVRFDTYGTPSGGAATSASACPNSVANVFSFAYNAAFDGADPTIGPVQVLDPAGAPPAFWVVQLTPRGYRW